MIEYTELNSQPGFQVGDREEQSYSMAGKTWGTGWVQNPYGNFVAISSDAVVKFIGQVMDPCKYFLCSW